MGRWTVVALFLSLHASVTHADPKPDRAKAVAKQYVDAGLAAQSSGDYDSAITFYEKAAALVPHPVLTFNIAQAHRLAGRIDQALRLYRAYLEADPHGSQAATAREIIAEIERQRAEAARRADEARAAEARKAAQARTDQARATERARADRARVDQARAEPARPEPARAEPARPEPVPAEPARAEPARPEPVPAEPARATPASEVAEPAAPGRTLRLAGLVTGATGVVALGVGIGFGVHAASLSDELSRPGAPYSKTKVAAGNRANKLEVAGLITGAALVGVGAALYWRGRVRDHREAIAIAPLVAPDQLGLVVTGALP
jgi:tetratricopeptide (TPR) repeat protein